MERYNPFGSSTNAPDELDPSGSSMLRSSDTALNSLSNNSSSTTSANNMSGRQTSNLASRTDSHSNDLRSSNSTAGHNLTQISSRYTTSFPDPFEGETIASTETLTKLADGRSSNNPATRSSSVTFANSVGEINTSSTIQSPSTTMNTQNTTRQTGRGQAGGLSSFLSRATSVTSSSVTDRVNEAVGSMRNAVDSISSQIQQVSNINERLSSTATNLVGLSSTPQQDSQDPTIISQQQQQQQQSAASYLASKFSSATNQFSSSSNQSSSLPVISRQRVVLILDSLANADWSQQFVNYRRLIAGLGPASSGPQSALSNFFNSATAQLTSSGSSLLSGEGSDLVEQVDFRDISVLANQSSSTATVLVNSSSLSGTSGSTSISNSRQTSPNSRSLITASGARIIRPEYVVVRQRCSPAKGDASSEHLRGIVTAFNYCLVPMFEPLDLWNTFQDKQLVFSRLLKIQKCLGKEQFPLIPQVFCQTYHDLLNHINSSTVSLPCLIRTGQSGKGKMRAENLQMLKDFASIVAISNFSCTVEPYLDVKCDLIIQKLGTSLKLFKRTNIQTQSSSAGKADGSGIITSGSGNINSSDGFGNYNNSTSPTSSATATAMERQAASRQTSLGSSVLSSLIPNSTTQQATNRRSSNFGSNFEKMTEMVNVRYKNWVEAISREFDNKLEVFCLKIVITSQDREYIVGLADCSMDFLGTQENQDEDKRSFVELIISNMNTLLPKHSLSREPSANMTPTDPSISGKIRRSSSDEKGAVSNALSGQSSVGYSIGGGGGSSGGRVIQEHNNGPLGDKKKFISQTQINGVSGSGGGGANNKGRGSATRHYGQLSSRSQSVSVNQSDYLEDQPMTKSSYFTRRGSERSDSAANDVTDDSSQQMNTDSTTSGLHQRQSSLGQSFLDQTSTAFSSFHKQSLSFFKRLDSRTGTTGSDLLSNTPPLSAKSDKHFDRTFAPANNLSSIESTNMADQLHHQTARGRGNDFKSQSVDCSGMASDQALNRPLRANRPPKPPPPQSLGSRQSSLASYSSQRVPSAGSMATPHSTPNQTRQNTTISEQNSVSNEALAESSSTPRSTNQRVVRQNSALSAFEPFDPELRTQTTTTSAPTRGSLDKLNSASIVNATQASALDRTANNRSLEPAVVTATKRGSQFDSASITSGDSNSTSETTTAEDTMNNLKKTFASIFGDKCE